MSLAEKGIIYNIQKYSIDDGPGIRTTVVFKGCPLRCKWCANPESQKTEPEIGHRFSQCAACGRCAAACPQQAITMTGDKRKLVIDRLRCAACGACVEACFPGAMHFFGREATAEEISPKWPEIWIFTKNPAAA
jgi:pyruvate formate lyase activating enzyme